jgi:hypothetical protein
MPASLERNVAELKVQMDLGLVLTSSQGWASPEKERAFERARALSQNIDEREDLLPILWNLGTMNLVQEAATALRLENVCCPLPKGSDTRRFL